METKGYSLTKLPLYTNETQDVRQLISRNISPKGEFTRLAVDEINYLAYVDFPLGKPLRANHYHEVKDEYLYICKGTVKGYFKSLSEDHAVEEQIIEEGTLIHILPGCLHAFEAIEEGHGIEFSPTKHELMECDVIECDLTSSNEQK